MKNYLKPKVLIINSTLLPISETFIKEQALNLQKWNFTLVGHSKIKEGLDLSLMNCIFFEGRLNLFYKLQRLICKKLNLPLYKDVNLLKKEHAQLIHVHFATEAVNIWPLAEKLKLPMLVSLHGYDINISKEWWESGKGGFCKKDYPCKLIKIAQQKNVFFVAVSRAIKDRAVKFGIPREKIFINYIGVDTKKFILGPKSICLRKEILFIGRLVEKKGCKYLLKAFSHIQYKFPEITLVIIGDGPCRNALENYAYKKSIRVRFCGALQTEKVLKYFGNARVLCLPSITAENGDAEGFGIVLLEAQAAGVPVISSARGGAQEGLIDGKTGIAFREKDVKAISDALEKTLGNDLMLLEYSKRARSFIIERFDIKNCTANLESIYDYLVK